MRFFVTAFTYALVVTAIALAAQLPLAKTHDAQPEFFSAARAMDEVRGLTNGNHPHNVGSDDHARARDYVVKRLRDLGLQPSIQSAHSCRETRRGKRCADIENIVAKMDGQQNDGALLLAAHYDSSPNGPGAADDGAGVATILEVIRALKTGPSSQHPIIVLIDDGEELGLLGAVAFVDAHPLAREVRVALNFEARGNRGQAAMFETSANSANLIKLYAASVENPTANSLIPALYAKLPNDTDMTIFKHAGMQGLNFAFADRVEDYHTARDTAARLDPHSVQHMGDQALAMTRALSNTEWSALRGGEEIYFDLFSLTLVRYPARFAKPFFLAALALFAFGVMSAFANNRRTRVVKANVATTSFFAITGALTAFYFPPGSHLFLVPLIFGAAALTTLSISTLSERAAWCLVLMSTVPGVMMWLALTRVVIVMVGAMLPAAVLAPLALALIVAAPALTQNRS